MQARGRGTIRIALGFIPWIAVGVLASQGHRVAGLAVGLTLAAALLAEQRRRGALKAMELAAAIYFGARLLALASPVATTLDRFDVALLYAALATMAWASLAIGSPFTLQYAREDWPRELWEQPLFRRTNGILTATWGFLFSAGAASATLAAAIPGFPGRPLALAIPGVATAVGVALSLVLPRAYPRRALARRLAAENGPRWPVPLFPPVRSSQPSRHDVIVVGAGVGGLTAGALLAQRGLKVLVLDHHHKAGGFCTSWTRSVGTGAGRKEFLFDAGVHDVSGLGPNGPVRWLTRRLGIESRLEWRHVAHEYRLPGLALKVPQNAADYVTLLAERFPADAPGVRALFAELEAVYREMYQDVPRTGGLPLRPRTVDEALSYPAAHPHAMRWMNLPFGAMLDRHVRDPLLRRTLSILTGYLTDAPRSLTVGAMAPIFGYYFDGGRYPVGGSQAFADALVAAIRKAGGEVRLRAPVRRILVEGGRAVGVESAGGRIDRTEAVVSNADARRTFVELVERQCLPAAFVRQVEALRPSTSAVSVYLGLDCVPDLEPLTLADTAAGGIAVAIPSKVDPSLAPEGHSSVSLLALVPADPAGWDRRAPGYRERKRRAGDALVERAAALIPRLRDHVVYRQDATPATVARYAWTTEGAIYGPAQGWRPPPRTPVPGLVLAGSGTFPGPGVEAAVISGTIAADILCAQPRADRTAIDARAHAPIATCAT